MATDSIGKRKLNGPSGMVASSTVSTPSPVFRIITVSVEVSPGVTSPKSTTDGTSMSGVEPLMPSPVMSI